MLNKIIISMMIGASSIAFAEGTAGELTKDEWLGKLKEVVPTMICKNFTQNESVNKQLESANINYDKCVTLIPASFDKCKIKFYDKLPSTINKDNAPEWGRSIGECIGSDFAVTYLVSPTQTTPGASSSATPATNPTTTADATTSATPPTTTDATTTPTDSSAAADTLTKDAWLGKLKEVAPELICKGFFKEASLNQRLTELKIDYNKCLADLPPSVDKCEKQFYAEIPTTIDNDSAEKWGHTIGECIGKDYAEKYLIGGQQGQ